MPISNDWWLALIPIIIIGAAVWRSSVERGLEHRRQQVAREDQRERAEQNNPHRPSPDFSALIHTIRAEGRAARAEERREDNAKIVRDWLTIVLLALTFGAIVKQVIEMVKVYDPISEQARVAVDSESKQLRAYVFSVITNFVPSLQPNIQTTATIRFVNGGATPAYVFWYKLYYGYMDMPFTIDKFDTPASEIPPNIAQGWPRDYLFKEHVGEYGSLPLSLTQDQINGVNKGRGGVFFWGEIRYKDIFGCKHHTNFCEAYFAQRGMPVNIYRCVAHNDVDDPDKCEKE